MRIYENTRGARVQIILWGSAVVFVLAAAFGLYSWSAGDIHNVENAIIVGVLFYLVLVGMAFYARRSVTALDIENGELVATTRGLTGPRRVFGEATIGAQKHDKGLSTGTAMAVSNLTGTLDALRFSGIDNQYRVLAIGPRRKKCIVDLTADPAMGERIARAAAELQADDGAQRTPPRRSRLRAVFANTHPLAWGFVHLAVVFALLALVVDGLNAHFYGRSLQTMATVTGKSIDRAGADKDGALEYYLHFTFRTALDKEVKSIRQVKHAFYDRTKRGDRIPVRYLPNQPTYNAIEFDLESTAAFTLWVFAWVFAGIAVLFFLRSLAGVFPAVRSVTGGLVLASLLAVIMGTAFRLSVPGLAGEVFETEARITKKHDGSKSPAGGETKHAAKFALEYEYTDHLGAKRTATKAVGSKFFASHAVGDEIVLRYAIKTPTVHDIESTSTIKAAFGFYLIAALLALAAALWWMLRLLFRRRKPQLAS